MLIKLFSLFLCTLFFEENFLLINGSTSETVVEMGSHLNERKTPCSTFKIALSLIGYDSGILTNEVTPVWQFQEGFDDFLPAWKNPQTPKSWMESSCVWYSQLLVSQLGTEQMQSYLNQLNYGNQDLSGNLSKVWINSSLAISAREQALFIQKMVNGLLPLSKEAVAMTKNLLFKEILPGGWKFFGKTGWGGHQEGEKEVGWFVGWVEKEEIFFPFAYNIQADAIDLTQRIPRVKQLLREHLFND